MATIDGSDAQPAVTGVDPLGAPLLRTRFALPARPGTFMRRERLVNHLEQAHLTPLTTVNGAAGAGKSLLVADWADGLRCPVAWLTADPADQAPGVFWAYLLESLRTSGVSLPEHVARPPASGQVDRTFLTRVAAGLSTLDPPVIVVLDEYERVTAPEISEQMHFVLSHAGNGLRLVLVGRNEPLLPLHRYRVAGDLTEIRNAELAFTSSEAAALLEAHGLRVAENAVCALVERTEGWAAGLRLCALAARQSPDPEQYLKEFEAGRSTVADFLLAEVLWQRPPEIQDLLLRVSVLERFSPDLANALTGRADAGPLLTELHRENAFVQDFGDSWYGLHPLFAEILRAHLRVQQPCPEPELHRRAARWLRRSGFPREALVHGAAADDWEFAADTVIDDLAIGQFFTGARTDELSDLFSRMAPETTGSSANLVRASLELSHHDLDRGLAHLRQAGEDLAVADGQDRAAARLSRAVLEALAARLTGSPDRAEAAAADAREARRHITGSLLDRHPEITALLRTHVGSALLWAGRFDDARAALAAAAASPAGTATALPRAEALGHLALIEHLDGWPGRAERTAAAAIAEGVRHSLGPRGGSGVASLVLAAVAVDRDELDEARTLLGAADAAPLPEDPVAWAGRVLVTARLHWARGHAHAALEAAAREIRAAVPSPWAQGHLALLASTVHLAAGRPEEAARTLETVPAGRLPAVTVEAAKAYLGLRNPARALGMLDRLPREAPTGPAVTVRATLVRAQAAHHAGDPDAAGRLVAAALVQARRERLRRPFLEAGPWIRPFLRSTHLQQLAEGWLTPGPRHHHERPTRPRSPDPSLVVEELSERERDVLRRLARAMSTEEIAEDLHLSVNTVKTHLKSAYRKLAVNRRNDAVRRARELRVL
ncbi:LuxR C-terminal-related transcriptional regulator [Streptomyces sp. TRM49041]|uniref:LuxR C-terminal-related transcriptional regulator n=1 Tax=Streptomyces sp. TRM49041 TaxID=2603216 RepID=UPI0011EFAC14|nr:LuxR C-terminal-related transcriptional regulator [Streptomyces sp. TRM49041]